MYVELSHLNEDKLYYILLRGIELSSLSEENEKTSKKKIISCLCAKFVFGAVAFYNETMTSNASI